MAVQSDGQIIVAGHRQGSPGDPVLRIKPGTVTSAAVLDGGFGIGGIAEVPGTVPTNNTDVAVEADGDILLLGQVATASAP